MMKCSNIFCVYQSDGECTVEEISIDSTGMCMDYIYPDIDEEMLKRAKNDLIKRLDERI